MKQLPEIDWKDIPCDNKSHRGHAQIIGCLPNNRIVNLCPTCVPREIIILAQENYTLLETAVFNDQSGIKWDELVCHKPDPLRILPRDNKCCQPAVSIMWFPKDKKAIPLCKQCAMSAMAYSDTTNKFKCVELVSAPRVIYTETKPEDKPKEYWEPLLCQHQNPKNAGSTTLCGAPASRIIWQQEAKRAWSMCDTCAKHCIEWGGVELFNISGKEPIPTDSKDSIHWTMTCQSRDSRYIHLSIQCTKLAEFLLWYPKEQRTLVTCRVCAQSALMGGAIQLARDPSIK